MAAASSSYIVGNRRMANRHSFAASSNASIASASALFDIEDEEGTEWMKKSYYEIVAMYVLVGPAGDDSSLIDMLKEVSIDIIRSVDCSEYKDNVYEPVAFVLEDFDGPIFRKLNGLTGTRRTIFGVPFVKKCIKEGRRLRFWTRPVFNGSMEDVVVCFTGFKDPKKLGRLAELVRFMGGNIRKAITPSVTHLVAATVRGEKYRAATAMDIPVMSADWIVLMWEARNGVFLSAATLQFPSSKLPPFYGLKLGFGEFLPEDIERMAHTSKGLGATIVDYEEADYFVAGPKQVIEPQEAGSRSKAIAVSLDWWTTSVELGICANPDSFRLRAKALKRFPSMGGEDLCAVLSPRKKLKYRESSIDIFADQKSLIDGGSFASSSFSRGVSCPDGFGASGPIIAKALVSDLSGIFAQNQRTLLHLVVRNGYIEVIKGQYGAKAEARGMLVWESVKEIVTISNVSDDMSVFAMAYKHGNSLNANTVVLQYHSSVDSAENQHLAQFERMDNFLTILYNNVHCPSSGRHVAMVEYKYNENDDHRLASLISACLKRMHETRIKQLARTSSRMVRSMVARLGRQSVPDADYRDGFAPIREEMMSEK